MATEIGIVDLLEVLGFDDRLKSKLVRHQDARYDVPALIRDGWFDLYQSLQKRPVFKDCKQIVSFVGDGSKRARFVGVYRVLNKARRPRRLFRQTARTGRNGDSIPSTTINLKSVQNSPI